MRIAIIAGNVTAGSAGLVSRQTVSLLRDWGCTVDLLRPEEQTQDLTEMSARYDVMLLNSRSTAALATSSVYHAQGANLLNAYPTVLAAGDPAVAARTLQLAGLHVPPTWLTTRPRELSTVAEHTRLILRGAYGRRSRLIGTADDLPVADGQPFLLQRFESADELPITVLQVGDAVFWNTAGTATEPSSVPSTSLRDLAVEAGRAFGTDLIGLTVVISEGRPYVVDVSAVPDLRRVPEAGLRLAEYVYAAATAVSTTGPGSRP